MYPFHPNIDVLYIEKKSRPVCFCKTSTAQVCKYFLYNENFVEIRLKKSKFMVFQAIKMQHKLIDKTQYLQGILLASQAELACLIL